MSDQNKMLESKWHEIRVKGEVGWLIKLVIGSVGSKTEVKTFWDLVSQTITSASSAAEISIQGNSVFQTTLRTRSLCYLNSMIEFLLMS